ncbi:MAG: hypothetical protein KAQ75_11770, partial [Bacteroidales bacterium]|nr:hypothetical protein [Bacteroidales bacterium]
FEYEHDNLLIIEKGRFDDEVSVVKIENGKYIGFGYADKKEVETDKELLHGCIKRYSDNHDVQQIIKSHIKKNNPDVISFT